MSGSTSVVGLGAIGLGVVEGLIRTGRRPIAVADPQWPTGSDLGSLIDNEAAGGVPIVASIPRAPDDTSVAVVCATSKLPAFASIATELLERGWHVVSSCEAALLGRWDDGEVSRELDEAARRANRCVVGCGVNPGFIMDVVPVMLAAVATDISEVEVVRRVDLTTRRPALRRKAGVGLSATQFKRLLGRGEVGHVGLAESGRGIAIALGGRPVDVARSVEPVVDHHGLAIGFVEVVVVTSDNGPPVSMELRMTMGEAPLDVIHFVSRPPLRIEATQGVAGDDATVAMLVNRARHIAGYPPGFISALELPPAPWQAQ